jgi:hypothetical protein
MSSRPESQVLVTEKTSGYGDQDANAVRDGLRVPHHAGLRKYEFCQQQAHQDGLHQCEQIYRSEPEYLVVQPVYRLAKDKKTIQDEGRDHAAQVGQNDRNCIDGPMAESYSRKKVDQSCEAARQQKEQELPLLRALGLLG